MTPSARSRRKNSASPPDATAAPRTNLARARVCRSGSGRPRRADASSSARPAPGRPPRSRPSTTMSPSRREVSAHSSDIRTRSRRMDALVPSSRTRDTATCTWSWPPVERPWRTATHRHGALPEASVNPRRLMASRTTPAHSSSESRRSPTGFDRARCQTWPSVTSVPYTTRAASSWRPSSPTSSGDKAVPTGTTTMSAAAMTRWSVCSSARPPHQVPDQAGAV